MIGNINFQKHQSGSEDIVNGILSNYKAHSKKVSADTFVEFVNNEISYTTFASSVVYNTELAYFYMTAVKMNDNQILLFHDHDTDTALDVSLITIDEWGDIACLGAKTVDSTPYSASSYKAIKISDNKLFVAHCSGDGSTYLKGRIVTFTYTSSTNWSISTVTSKNMSNHKGSSSRINLMPLEDGKVLLVHASDNGVSVGAPAAMQVTFTNGFTDFSYTSDTILAQSEMSYADTYACKIDNGKFLTIHASDSSNRYLKAIVSIIRNGVITPVNDIMIAQISYASQGARCVAVNDNYVLVTYDDTDKLAAKLLKINNDYSIDVVNSTILCSGEGSYEHEIVKIDENQLFVTYCADMMTQEWEYGLVYIRGEDIITDKTGVYDSPLYWPTSGSAGLALCSLDSNDVLIFYADTNNKISQMLLRYNNVDVTSTTTVVDTNIANPTHAIKINDNRAFITHAYSDGSDVSYRLYGALIDISNDQPQVVYTAFILNENNSTFMESENRMIQASLSEIDSEVIILINKYVDDSTRNLYYGILNINLQNDTFSIGTLTKVTDENQNSSSTNIIKIPSSNDFLITYGKSDSSQLLATWYRISYNASNHIDSISTVVNLFTISNLKDSDWMYNYIFLDDTTLVFLFRNNVGTTMMHISTTVAIIDPSSNSVSQVIQDKALVSSNEAAMCIQPVKINSRLFLLFCCDYDPNVGSWGAWYLGAIPVIYTPDASPKTIASYGSIQRVSNYNASYSDIKAIKLGLNNFVVVGNDYDENNNVVLSAKRVDLSRTMKVCSQSGVTVLDLTNTGIMNLSLVKLDEGKYLVVHPDKSNTYKLAMQIIYAPNFIGPSVKESELEIGGLSKTNASMIEEGEVYTKT